MDKFERRAAFCMTPALLFFLAATWLTHIVVCIKTAQVLFLIAGALCFPVGIIHGFGLWFGIW